MFAVSVGSQVMIHEIIERCGDNGAFFSSSLKFTIDIQHPLLEG